MQVNDELDQLIGTRTRSIVRKLRSVERLEDADAASALLGTGALPGEPGRQEEE